MSVRTRVGIVGAPMDLGAARRGVDMGPSAIRYAGLDERLADMGVDVVDLGDVDTELPETAPQQDESARYLSTILATCRRLATRVAEVSRDERVPLVLGGDHSIAMGTLAGLASVHGHGGVVWVDAHGDLNRPRTSPSGNVHGMPLSGALGACGFGMEGFEAPPWLDPARVALIGVRDLDQGEKDLIDELGLCALTMADVDRRGIGSVVHEAMTVVQGPGFVHLSLDADACDPLIAPGVGTPVRGGLSYREAHLAMELLAEAELITSVEVVEVNPTLDHANETALLLVDLIVSALGATIL